MSVYVDLICSKCGIVKMDQWSDEIGDPHVTSTDDDSCDGEWERLWTVTDRVAPGTHTSEKVVVYESQSEGKIQYPGRSDVPVPDRLAQRGYVRRELNVRDLASFEKKHHVANERRHFDRNGRGF